MDSRENLFECEKKMDREEHIENVRNGEYEKGRDENNSKKSKFKEWHTKMVKAAEIGMTEGRFAEADINVENFALRNENNQKYELRIYSGVNFRIRGKETVVVRARIPNNLSRFFGDLVTIEPIEPRNGIDNESVILVPTVRRLVSEMDIKLVNISEESEIVTSNQLIGKIVIIGKLDWKELENGFLDVINSERYKNILKKDVRKEIDRMKNQRLKVKDNRHIKEDFKNEREIWHTVCGHCKGITRDNTNQKVSISNEDFIKKVKDTMREQYEIREVEERDEDDNYELKIKQNSMILDDSDNQKWRRIQKKENKIYRTEKEKMDRIKWLKEKNEWIEQIKVDESELNTDQKLRLYEMLNKNEKAFAKSDNDTGRTDAIKFRIHMENKTPIRQRQYQLSPDKREAVEEWLKKNLENGTIAPCNSEWNSPLTVVGKQDGGMRVCVDLRKINERTIKESVPMKTIQDYLERIGRGAIFSSLDVQSAFNSLKCDDETSEILSFTHEGQKYCFRYMPFGGKCCLWYYQKFNNFIASDMDQDKVLMYVDDILVVTQTIDDNLDHLERVMERMASHGLKFKCSKVELFQKEIKFLGHILTREGMHSNPEKIIGLLKAEPPKNAKGVKSFLAAVNFWSQYIPEAFDVSAPLYDLLRKDTPFRWGQKEQEAYGKLMRLLATSPLLRPFEHDKPTILFADSSDRACASMLAQMDENRRLYATNYWSRKWTEGEDRKKIWERECIAIMDSIHRYRQQLLISPEITAFTDNAALSYVTKLRGKVTDKHYRWNGILADYDINVQYIPGKSNVVADWLSRAVKEERMVIPLGNKNMLTWPFLEPREDLTKKWRIEALQHLNSIDIEGQMLHESKCTNEYVEEFVRKPKKKMEQQGIRNSNITTKEVDMSEQMKDLENDNIKMESDSLAGIFSRILTGNESKRRIIQEEIIKYIRKHRDYAERDKKDTIITYVGDPTRGKIDKLDEIFAVTNYFKIPILYMNDERDRIIYPIMSEKIINMPPLGYIAEIQEHEGRYRWLNRSLVREHKTAYANGTSRKEARKCINEEFYNRETTWKELTQDEAYELEKENMKELLTDEDNIKIFGHEILNPIPIPYKEWERRQNEIIKNFEESKKWEKGKKEVEKKCEEENRDDRKILVKMNMGEYSDEDEIDERKIGRRTSQNEVFRPRIMNNNRQLQEYMEPHKHNTRGRLRVVKRKIPRIRARRPKQEIEIEMEEMNEGETREERMEIIRDLQKNDELCRVMKKILNGEDATEIAIRYREEFEKITENMEINADGLLIKKESIRDRAKYGEMKDKIVAPLKYLRVMLFNLHNKLGHLGAEKTANLLAERVYRPSFGRLPDLNTITREYVKDCIECKRKSGTLRIPRAKLSDPPRPSKPFQMWACDFTAGYETSETGYTHVCSYIDLFSRYIVAVPTVGETADEATRVLLQHVLPHHGLPEIIQSDNGPAFTSERYREICKTLAVNKTYVIPYTPWANGMVERSNRILKDLFRAYVRNQNTRNWDEYFYIIPLIMNNTVSRSTGETPCFVARGMDQTLPFDLMRTEVELERIYAIGDEGAITRAKDLRRKMQIVAKEAKERMDEVIGKEHEKINKKRKTRKVEEGDIVMIRLPLPKDKKKTMVSPIMGPFRVGTVGSLMINVREIGGKKEYPIHINNVILVTKNFERKFTHWTEVEESMIERLEKDVKEIEKEDRIREKNKRYEESISDLEETEESEDEEMIDKRNEKIKKRITEEIDTRDKKRKKLMNRIDKNERNRGNGNWTIDDDDGLDWIIDKWKEYDRITEKDKDKWKECDRITEKNKDKRKEYDRKTEKNKDKGMTLDDEKGKRNGKSRKITESEESSKENNVKGNKRNKKDKEVETVMDSSSEENTKSKKSRMKEKRLEYEKESSRTEENRKGNEDKKDKDRKNIGESRVVEIEEEVNMRQTRSMEKERRENNKNNKRKGKEHTEKEEAEPELKKQKEPPDKGLKRGNDIIKGYQTRSKGRK